MLFPTKKLTLTKTRIMGIVNTAPDSFSDGGLFVDTEKAVAHCLKLEADGADIIDIGGESTRPGSKPIPVAEEISRVLPVIKKIRKLLPGMIISIDTYKSEVARECIAAGADMVNDISSLQFDDNMKEVLSYYKNIPVVLMHIQGTPKNMQKNPSYKDPVDDILDFFEKRLSFCVRYGIELDRIIIDPGIGFGKKFIHNIEIIKRIGEFHKLGLPVMIGASRKSFLNKIFTSQPQERLAGTLATTCIALRNNVGIVRVHDVKENRQFIDTSYTITQHPS